MNRIELVRAYLQMDCEDGEMDRVMVRTLTLLLEGQLEEAYLVAESLCEPYRSEIQGRILLLSPEPSLVAGVSDQMKVYLFTRWLNDELSDPSYFIIRDKILYEVTTGFAPLAYRHAEELTDPDLATRIEEKIRELIASYCSANR